MLNTAVNAKQEALSKVLPLVILSISILCYFMLHYILEENIVLCTFDLVYDLCLTSYKPI